MTRDTINWLHDVLRLGGRILKLVEPLEFEEHRTDFLRIGVERYLISIGDALRPALRQRPDLGDRVPDARNAIDLRNFRTHAYIHIDDLVVWNVVTTKLPRLLEDIERVIREEEPLSSDL